MLRYRVNFILQSFDEDFPLIWEEPEGELEDASTKKLINDKSSVLKNIYSTLLIAYHNLAVEYEYERDYEAAVEAYDKALATADLIGETLPIVLTIRKSRD